MRIQPSQHLFILLFVFFAIHLNAQESFERAYPAGNDAFSFGVAIQQTSDGGYISLSTYDTLSTNSSVALITKFSPKGNVDWAKTYDLDLDVSASNLVLLETDTFAIICRGENNTNRILSKFTPDGDLIWSHSHTPPNNLLDATHDLLAIEETKGFAVFNSILRGEKTDLSISFLDSLGMIEQANIYPIAEKDGHFAKAQRDTDEGYIVAGHLDFTEYSSFLFKLDSLQNGTWSQVYQTASEVEGLKFSAIVPTLDSGYLVTGEKYILNPDNQLDSATGFLLKVNAEGLPQWGKTLQLDTINSETILLDNIIANDDGSFVITGLKRDDTVADRDLFMLQIDALGNVLWIKKYSQVISGHRTDFIRTQDDGYAFFAAKRLESANNRAMPYLAKVDANGVSSCEDTISFFMDTLIVQMDTLVFDIESYDDQEEVTPTVENFNDYEVPILSLEIPPPFCEDEAIEWTFDANTPGAVSYEWSTGETTDTITVTEEGMYTVDVRIETDVCYNLCDTAMITTMGPPMVTIINQGNFCLEGSTTLVSSFSGAADSIVWSTGETGQAIEVMASGTYSVTVTNRCGIGEATIEVIEQTPTVMITELENTLCEGGEVTLGFDAPNANSFLWSDGSVVDTIVVNAEGTYSVTVSNECGMASDEINLNCIFVTDDCLDIPNLFTPNNDDTNDDFEAVIKDECAANVIVRTMRIYNRWGQLVFESINGQSWDGRYKDILAPSDVYVYYIEIENTSQDENGGVEVRSGDVTLIR